MISLDDWRARGQVHTHRGHDIFFVEEGSGPALLLVHGFPTASWDWTRVWPDLSFEATSGEATVLKGGWAE